ncbi:hypothetical protein [Amycolatopsis sp. WGS_07]|uniref:hypothetical protein n=1 Tax=Amycolatopsis sp. WGS_07 TaxID=3076764 RepID=UPI0038735A58
MLAPPTGDPLSACRVDVDAAGGVDEFVAVLARRGIALFDGVRDTQALRALAERLGHVVRHRDSDSTGLTVITDRGEGAARAGPGSAPERWPRTRTVPTSPGRRVW